MCKYFNHSTAYAVHKKVYLIYRYSLYPPNPCFSHNMYNFENNSQFLKAILTLEIKVQYLDKQQILDVECISLLKAL